MLLVYSVEPFMEHAWVQMDMLYNSFEQSCVQPMLELCYHADIVTGSPSLTPQMFEFSDELVQLISLHFYFEELLVSGKLLLAIHKGISEISFKDCP